MSKTELIRAYAPYEYIIKFRRLRPPRRMVTGRRQRRATLRAIREQRRTV